jgi:hypothetical protein
LIFVGLSINISRIISIPRLPGRAIQSLTVLAAILVSSLLVLVPGQSLLALGAEILVVGVCAFGINTRFDFVNFKMTERKYRGSYLIVVALDQSCVILYILAGIATLLYGEVGIYLLVPATVFSFLKAIIDAWVLLVEINR